MFCFVAIVNLLIFSLMFSFLRHQKRKNDFKRDDPEFQRERRRISKLLLNDHYDTEKGSSHRVWIYSVNVCMFVHIFACM